MPADDPSTATTDSRHDSVMAIDGDYLCPDCGYNLRGLVADRCPECGKGFDRDRLSDSRIPWAHRRSTGRMRAYWRTVLMVTRKPRLLADELARPVSFRDSQSFRWITILHAWLPFLIATAIDRPKGPWIVEDVWLGVAFHLPLLLTLAVVTGLPSYFFHPRRLPVEMQNRAVALSYYTSAPLAWGPIVYLFSVLITGNQSKAGLVLFAGFMLLLVLFWWTYLLKLARRSRGGVLLPAVVILFLWVVVGGSVYLLANALIRLAGLMYFSLYG